MATVFALLAGLLFGTGLCLSGMIDPGKVLGFLDLAGAWDPSLALVMGGALAVGLPAFVLAKRRTRSLILDVKLDLPASRAIDGRLIAGSTLFGIGWGLAGICPGPGLALLALGSAAAVLFVAAMLAGMFLFNLTDRLRAPVATIETAQDT